MSKPQNERMTFFEVVNLEKFQHYKNRCPPWIKLYRSVLTDYEFTSLPDDAKAHLMLIWVLASETGNSLPWDANWLGKRINCASIDLQLLHDCGFIKKRSGRKPLAKHEIDASNSLAPEEERQRRDRDRGEESHSSRRVRKRTPPNTRKSKSGDAWAAYSAAYAERYGTEPSRSAKTNSILCKLVDEVGAEDAPKIAAHFLTMDSALYTSSMHDPTLLIRDAQKIRTCWRTGTEDPAPKRRANGPMPSDQLGPMTQQSLIEYRSRQTVERLAREREQTERKEIAK